MCFLEKLLKSFARIDLLVIDDWRLSKLIKDQRHGLRSTLIAGQLTVEHWHEIIGEPTLADAILDRLLHNTCKFNLKGESMRKSKSKLTPH
jgi:DNA replication protein DnaC